MFFRLLSHFPKTLAPDGEPLFMRYYWSISILALLSFLFLPYLQYRAPRVYTYLFAIVVGFYLSKVIVAVFLLIDDLRRIIQWAISKAQMQRPSPGQANEVIGQGISRSAFLSWLGIGLGGSLFSSLIYGFSNKYNYRIHRQQLAYDNLPAGFKGLKIVQLSDIHSGSLARPRRGQQGDRHGPGRKTGYYPVYRRPGQ